MYYDVVLENDGDTLLATCPDLPEVASVGDDEGEALLNVVEAIELAIQVRIAEREPVPEPSRHRKGHHPVRVPAQAAVKALLHNEMLKQNMRKSDLARAMSLHMPQVDRILNPKHSTKLETLELAFEKLGKHLEVRAG